VVGGACGVMTGSINVITMNMNRIKHLATQGAAVLPECRDEVIAMFHKHLLEQASRVHQYQVAYRSVMGEYLENNMLTCYDAGFIDMEKQFLTLGVNGLVEAAEQIGLVANNNEDYRNFVKSTLKVIFDANREAAVKYGLKFNTEFVPSH
jgi:ribonucleoside-triphosphate reductase